MGGTVDTLWKTAAKFAARATLGEDGASTTPPFAAKICEAQRRDPAG